jgi:hypothetical protein
LRLEVVWFHCFTSFDEASIPILQQLLLRIKSLCFFQIHMSSADQGILFDPQHFLRKVGLKNQMHQIPLEKLKIRTINGESSLVSGVTR